MSIQRSPSNHIPSWDWQPYMPHSSKHWAGKNKRCSSSASQVAVKFRFSQFTCVNSPTPRSQLCHLNTKIFDKLEIYPYIPEVSEPMCAVKIMNDRFIPSIEQLIAADLVDTAKVAEMKKKYAG